MDKWSVSRAYGCECPCIKVFSNAKRGYCWSCWFINYWLSSIVVAKTFGAKKVIASARYPQQVEAAKKMGADVVVSSKGEFEDACFDASGGIELILSLSRLEVINLKHSTNQLEY